MVGIYKFTSPTNKSYIGQSVEIEKRFKQHNRLKSKPPGKFKNSIIKYGHENHIFEIIEECLEEELDEREYFHKKQFIDEFGWGMALFHKLRDGLGGHLNQETKDKISKAKKGIIYSKERNKKIGDSNRGKKRSEETKLKISQKKIGISVNKGIIRTKEFRENASNLRKGKKHSKKWCDNMSKGMMGKNIKPIICITTGIKYESIKQASKLLNIGTGSIGNNLIGLSKQTKNKLIFKYL